MTVATMPGDVPEARRERPVVAGVGVWLDFHVVFLLGFHLHLFILRSTNLTVELLKIDVWRVD